MTFQLVQSTRFWCRYTTYANFFLRTSLWGAEFFCAYDGDGNIVRSIDISGKKEYNYEYEEGRIVRATESDIELSGEIVIAKSIVNTVKYYYKDGELKRVENILDENNMTIMEIKLVSKEVDESVFKVPRNYMDMTKFFEGEMDPLAFAS